MFSVNQYITNWAYFRSDFKSFGVWYLLFVKGMIVISRVIGKFHVEKVSASDIKVSELGYRLKD